MTPKALQGLLSSQFPADATCWSKATDEVRDMARSARLLGWGTSGDAIDFRALDTPSLWNAHGIGYIISAYERMNEAGQQAFINEHKDWIDSWLAAARKRRGPPVELKTIYTRVCNTDRLSNKEVREGYEFFATLSEQLYKAGPAFVIAAKEAGRTADTLRGFAVARKLVD